MRVLLGDIEFGEFMVGSEITPMALVHRPYRMLTLDDDIAQDTAENLIAQQKYPAYVIPDLFDGEVAVSWRKEDGDF